MVYIYALVDPINKEIRYVGKTFDLQKRFSNHLRDPERTHKTNWIKSLVKKEFVPIIQILEMFDDSQQLEWEFSERFWILILRGIGCNLTNLESGGRSGKRVSEETKIKMRKSAFEILPFKKEKTPFSPEKRKEISEKISIKLTGRKRPPEVVEKVRIALTGRKISEETRIKLIASNWKRGKVTPKETRDKISKAHLGMRHTPESCEKMRLSHLGVKIGPHSQQTKDKIRASNLKVFARKRLLKAICGCDNDVEALFKAVENSASTT